MLSPIAQTQLQQLFPQLMADPALAQALFKQAQAMQLKAGQSIAEEGRHCQHLAFLLSGSARVFKLGETGREITLYRVNPGESCILTASSINSEKPFPAFAVAASDLTAVVMPASVVRDWSERFPALRHYLWTLLSERMSEVLSLVEEVVFSRLDRRLADFLVRQQQAQPAQNLKLTHQQIAAELGTSREVISRLLKEMEQEGLIETGRGWVKALEEGVVALSQPRL